MGKRKYWIVQKVKCPDCEHFLYEKATNLTDKLLCRNCNVLYEKSTDNHKKTFSY